MAANTFFINKRKKIPTYHRHSPTFLILWTSRDGGEGERGWFCMHVLAAFTNAAACTCGRSPLPWTGSEWAAAQNQSADQGLRTPDLKVPRKCTFSVLMLAFWNEGPLRTGWRSAAVQNSCKDLAVHPGLGRRKERPLASFRLLWGTFIFY